MEVGNSIPAPCIVHRRSALERYGYWPDHLWRGEPLSAIDWELWRKMLRPLGGRNLAYVPEPTAIHFRASWRDAARWGLPVWSEWAAERRDGTTWWPEELAVDMTGAATPQEAAWRALEADAVGWAGRLREGTRLVLDGWAGEAVGLRQHLVATTGQVHGLEQEVERLRGEIAGREERMRDLEDALRREADRGDEMTTEVKRVAALNAAILTSRSWHLMAPARTAGRLLRRAGAKVRATGDGMTRGSDDLRPGDLATGWSAWGQRPCERRKTPWETTLARAAIGSSGFGTRVIALETVIILYVRQRAPIVAGVAPMNV